MNKETIELLEKLAEKLGTTSEYLWGVLIKQSYVNAIENIVLILITMVICNIMYNLHKHFSNDHNDYSYYKMDEAIIIPMTIAGIISFGLIVSCFFSISSIITGLSNPEYWALKQILQTIR